MNIKEKDVVELIMSVSDIKHQTDKAWLFSVKGLEGFTFWVPKSMSYIKEYSRDIRLQFPKTWTIKITLDSKAEKYLSLDELKLLLKPIKISRDKEKKRINNLKNKPIYS